MSQQSITQYLEDAHRYDEERYEEDQRYQEEARRYDEQRNEELRHYWGPENQELRMADISNRHLTWENERLSRMLQSEKNKVSILTEQLNAANKRIRELTGEPEPEPEPEVEPEEFAQDDDFRPKRSYCGQHLTNDQEEQPALEENFDYDFDEEAMLLDLSMIGISGRREICEMEYKNLQEAEAEAEAAEEAAAEEAAEEAADTESEDNACFVLKRQYCRGTSFPVGEHEKRLIEIYNNNERNFYLDLPESFSDILQAANNRFVRQDAGASNSNEGFFGELPNDGELLEPVFDPNNDLSDEESECFYTSTGILVGSNGIRVCLDPDDNDFVARHETNLY
jgi:hypothetical protein